MLKGDIRYVLFADRITQTENTTSISTEKIDETDFILPEGLKICPFTGLGEEEEIIAEKPEIRKDFFEDKLDEQGNPLNPLK
jgi:hypothetical protein